MSTLLPIYDTQPVRPAYAQGPRSLAAVRMLRLSVTDRCNLRCVYCMPDDGVTFFAQQDVLSTDQIIAVARAAAAVGINHFKVTGGEPTVRSDLLRIVEALAELGPADLSMTTNGLLLDQLAVPLRRAGLDRITVSCDSLLPDRFDRITGGRCGPEALDKVLRGLEAASRAGFSCIKLNVVVMGGINDDEVADFAKLTFDRPWTVRFIEYMPLGDSELAESFDRYAVDNAAVRACIERELGKLSPVSRSNEAGVGPAQVYRLSGAAGRIGFISAMSQPFCETCNRLRLTARGELRACLFDGDEVDLMPALSPVPDEAMIVALMRRCVALKPPVHSRRGNRAMSQMGG